MYKFRRLSSDETRVLFLRHGKYGAHEVITADEAERIRARGDAIDRAGIKIKTAYSSPRPRAVHTTLLFIEGAEQTPCVVTESRLGDPSMDPRIDFARLKEEAKNSSIRSESYLMTSQQYEDIMDTRGSEGALALELFKEDAKGETILVTSHGGARMEVTLLTLLDQNSAEIRMKVTEGTHRTISMVECGQIIEVIFGSLIEIRYLTDADLGIAEEVQS